MDGQEQRRKKDPLLMADPTGINRTEFEGLKETVHETTNAVNQLIPTVKNLVQSVESLSRTVGDIRDEVAESRVPKGISTANVLSALGVLATWTLICAGMVVQYVQGSYGRIETKIDNHSVFTTKSLDDLEEQFHRHETTEAHPIAAKKLEELKTLVWASVSENETQHRWIADVIGLTHDITRLKADPSYEPVHNALEGVGRLPSKSPSQPGE